MTGYRYKRNALLLGLFYGFSGANALIAYLAFEASREWLWMGITLLAVTPVIVIDKRKENKSNFAVWGGTFVHLLVTVLCMISGFEPVLAVLYFLELAVCIYVWRRK